MSVVVSLAGLLMWSACSQDGVEVPKRVPPPEGGVKAAKAGDGEGAADGSVEVPEEGAETKVGLGDLESLELPELPKIRRVGAVIPNYRVALKTKGGRKFTGIVIHDSSFHRHVHVGAHHEAEVYFSPEEFTLRFVDDLDGEVRLAWNKVASLEVREILGPAAIKKVEERRDEDRAARLQASRRRVELRRQRQKEEAGRIGPPVQTPPSTDPPKVREEVAEATAPEGDRRPALLTTFRPEDGWGLPKKEKLEWRRTVLGLFPNEKEQAFLDRFDDWEEALASWTAQQQVQGDGGDEAATPPTPTEDAKKD